MLRRVAVFALVLVFLVSGVAQAEPDRSATVARPTVPGSSVVGSQPADYPEALSSPEFPANQLLVKLSEEASRRVREGGPEDTGVAALDAAFKEHRVTGFEKAAGRSAQSRQDAEVFRWYRVTFEGSAERVSRLPDPTGDRQTVGDSAGDRLARLSARLRADPDVVAVEANYLFQTQLTPSDPYYAGKYPTAKFGSISQWAPQAVSAPAAWDVTLGDPSIVIAVVDTGVDTGHPDLQGQISAAYSVIGQGTKDDFGHGTHVAGIAAAATNNGVGVAGICQRCRIMSVKVLDATGSGYLSDIANGVVYAADHGARVINLSLGGQSRTQLMRDAIDYAFSKNALPVTAMGNNGLAEALEPAYWYNALSVGAIDQSGARASFSNYGQKTDVVAPGVAVLATMPTYSVTMNQQYGYKLTYDALSGTSMATPVVSGIAGLVLSRNPSLSAGQVKGIIEASAGDGKSFSATTGFGPVNAAKAVALAAQTDAIPPTANVVAPAASSTVSQAFLLQAAPTDNRGVHHVDFVIGGTRVGAPGTAATSGKGGSATPAWATQWESTRYWNGAQTVTAVAFDTSGNSTSKDTTFAIRNAYATRTRSAHLCNPPTPTCNYYFGASDYFGLQYPAAPRLQVSWTYTRLDNYTGAFWGSVFNGMTQEILYTRGESIDFYSGITLCGNGCGNNAVSAGMTQVVKGKGGSAEADVTLVLTYPQ